MSIELKEPLLAEYQAVWNRLPKKDRKVLEERIATVFEKPMTAPLGYAHKNNAGYYIVCLSNALKFRPQKEIHFIIAHELGHVWNEHNGPTGEQMKKMSPEERQAWIQKKYCIRLDADAKETSEFENNLRDRIALVDRAENEADEQTIRWGFAKELIAFYGPDYKFRDNSTKSFVEVIQLVAYNPTYTI